MNFLYKQLFSWLNLADYDDAVRHSSDQIIARYARGNVSMQNSWFIDEEGLKKLSREGDVAISNPKFRAIAALHGA